MGALCLLQSSSQPCPSSCLPSCLAGRQAHLLPMRLATQRSRIAALLVLLLAALASSAPVWAQIVVHSDENLAPARPEAWAMNYVAASSLMTAFGATPALPVWGWGVAVDAGYIPRLSDAQQRVGLHGIKFEDLNRSPVFGRLRLMLGLPGDFVAEVGYTPPLSIAGTQPLDLFAYSIGRRLYDSEAFSFSMQLFGQHGRAQGDVTCPANIAGNPDREQNPFGCQAPSNDHITLNYYGVEATSAWSAESWHAHASVGVVRTQFAVQVDAFTFNVHDRSYLVAHDSLPFYTIGASHDLDAQWTLGAELLYVPLRVQRQIDGPTENDSLTSLRLQLLYRFN